MAPTRTRLRRVGALALSLSLLAALAEGGEALENLAKALVEQRAAVEKLASELELEKSQLQDEQRARALRRADLERQLAALQQERTELDEAIAEREAKEAKALAARAALAPLAKQNLALQLELVRASLPFKQAERLAELERLRSELAAGKIEGDQALRRLWSSLEDELRLTRENGLYRQRIELDGQPVLVDVVKLGMVLLYFRAPDGRVGHALRGPAGWRFQVLTEEGDRERLRLLFEAFEKHVRRGTFDLPLPPGTRPQAAEVAPLTSRAQSPETSSEVNK